MKVVRKEAVNIDGNYVKKEEKSPREELGLRRKGRKMIIYKEDDLVWGKSKKMNCPKWPGIIRRVFRNWTNEISGAQVEFIGQFPGAKVWLIQFLNAWQ